MDWFKINCVDLDGPEFEASTHEEIATWLRLMAHSCRAENGGRIEGARLLRSRYFERKFAVTLADLRAGSELWSWEGDDLVLRFYPVEEEALVRRKREGGKKGAKVRWNGSPTGTPNRTPYADKIRGEETRLDERKNNALPTVEDCVQFASEVPTSAEVARQYHADRSALGWVVVKGGVEIPVADWRNDMRRFASHWQQNERKNGAGGTAGKVTQAPPPRTEPKLSPQEMINRLRQPAQDQQ